MEKYFVIYKSYTNMFYVCQGTWPNVDAIKKIITGVKTLHCQPDHHMCGTIAPLPEQGTSSLPSGLYQQIPGKWNGTV